MSKLATGSWSSEEGRSRGSRISWCVEVCEEYFGVDGALHKLLLKDLRRRNHMMPTLVSSSLLPSTEEEVAEVVKKQWHDRRFSLLDVGSCYNPFLCYLQFEVTAIDIAPADKVCNVCIDITVLLLYIIFQSVLECDFLSVSIATSNIALMSRGTTSTQVPLPSCEMLLSDSYDIVVFSLLLSFFPLPRQRMECCIRAHQLLKLHGLLLLITPDSSHQNRHAPMMKAWKSCIESIGFHRWKYFKDVHLHCMAFRKIMPTQQDYAKTMENSHQLYIPQDKVNYSIHTSSSNIESSGNTVEPP